MFKGKRQKKGIIIPFLKKEPLAYRGGTEAGGEKKKKPSNLSGKKILTGKRDPPFLKGGEKKNSS